VLVKFDVGAASRMESIQRWLSPKRLGESISGSRLFASMSIITIAMAARLALRIVIFGIVATSMGAEQFGALATVSALITFFSSFSGWGADQLLFRRVGRARGELPRAIATALVFLALSAPALIVLAVVLIPFAIDSSIPWLLVLFISISDIGLAQVNSIVAGCYQAVGRPMGTLWLTVGFSTVRVVAAVLWINSASHHDALSWSYYYLAVSAIAAVVSLWLVPRYLCKPDWKIAWHDWRDGFHFALQTASQTAFGSTDKPVIAALADLQTAGLYAAATRIVAAAGIPVSALLYSAYVRFFEVGVSGPRSSARLAIRLLPFGLALGAVGAFAILLLAPLAPRVLGSSYIGTETALFILAPLPMVSLIQSLGLDIVISIGRTGLRTLAQLAMPPINILLCWFLVPSHGATGAALASVATRVIIAIAAWAIVAVLLRRETASSSAAIESGQGVQAPLAE
jgi:O-antigen/teichoic acid export membrane protein